MQGALLSSDRVLTVSQSYAHEITHDPSASCGLHAVLSSTPVRYQHCLLLSVPPVVTLVLICNGSCCIQQPAPTHAIMLDASFTQASIDLPFDAWHVDRPLLDRLAAASQHEFE